jgi:ankyrin repeat protein
MPPRTCPPGQYQNKWTPLFLAISNGRSDLVTSLISRGADVNYIDQNGHSPLDYANQAKRTEIILALAKAGARVVSPLAGATASPVMTYTGGSLPVAAPIPALYQAVRMHDIEKVRALLRAGADPNERAPGGWAPLHQAVYNEPAICLLLLESGADVNARVIEPHQSSNATPLLLAAYINRSDIAAELLRHGADRSLKDSHGKTALDVAREHHNNQLVALLKN